MHTQDTTCACGCGEVISPKRRYVSGHNLRNLPRTAEHSRKIGEGQKRAWRTKRQRMPVGSRYLDHDGYVRIKVVSGKGAWRGEHILMMEAAIGRSIASGEEVHHINGIRDDNRLDNLYLCKDTSHHMKVERTFYRLLADLIEDGIVTFDHEIGEYRRA